MQVAQIVAAAGSGSSSRRDISDFYRFHHRQQVVNAAEIEIYALRRKLGSKDLDVEKRSGIHVFARHARHRAGRIVNLMGRRLRDALESILAILRRIGVWFRRGRTKTRDDPPSSGAGVTANLPVRPPVLVGANANPIPRDHQDES